MSQQSTSVDVDTRALWEHVFGDERGFLQIWSVIPNKDEKAEERSIKSRFFQFPNDIETAQAYALELAGDNGRNVYFCSHLLKRATNRRKENATNVTTLWGEQDGAALPNGNLTPTAVVESSPGHFHVYWRLTDAIPPEIAEQLNKRIAAKIDADPSGFDLTQLLRVPGTANYKYEGTPMVRVMDLRDESYVPTDLEALLPEVEEPEYEPEDDADEPPVALSPDAMKVWRGEEPKVKEDGTGEIDRSSSLMKIGRVLYDAGGNRCTVVEGLEERDKALGWNCYTDRRDDREYHRIFDKLKEGGRNNVAYLNTNGKPKKAAPPTHDVLRDRWLERNPDHAFGLGEWQHYSSGVWSQVSETTVKAQVLTTVEDAKKEGVKPTSALVNSVTELARIKRFVPDEKWDSNPDVLVCQNGALHISTRELRPHSPSHYATSALPYNYSQKAHPAVWHLFLNMTVPAAAEFLQEYAGYCLTIDTSHELAVWLAGPPGCGKSTFIAGLEAMLGHRVGVLGLTELERNRFALAKLKGKTLMTATEKPTNYLASEGGILNAIISGEPLQVERKYQDPYDLIAHAKILWAMNELPRVADASSGLFRRVKVVKFPRLDDAERDPDIKEGIKQEGAGILNWALEGLERLQERGRFEIPQAVENATADFRESNDVPALFVAEMCVEDADATEASSKLYKEYKFWCEENGHRPQSSTTIAEDWQRLGFERYRKKGKTFYRGVRLRLPSGD